MDIIDPVKKSLTSGNMQINVYNFQIRLVSNKDVAGLSLHCQRRHLYRLMKATGRDQDISC